MLKVGLVGFGRMGRLYAAEFEKHPLWELSYICDTRDSAIEMAQSMYPNTQIVRDEDKIFDDPDVKVVALCALADSRPAQIYKALATGKHIMAEKPVAEHIDTEWQLLSDIESSNLMVAVNIFNRNAWYHHDIVNFIRSGEIGELAIVRVAHQTPGHLPQEGHNPEGPAFHDCGMHYVDVARWYANSEYDTYHAQGIRMWSYPDPWWIQVHGTFKNGVVFEITQGFVYGHMAKDQTHNCYVDVIGTKGIARMNHDFKNATVELHGVTRTERKTLDFGDKKTDVMVDVLGKSILAGKNLGFPVVRDSVIASDMAWKMFQDAVKNGAPCIGTPAELEEIYDRRKNMTEGYGLPVNL
ncbi:MAG: Gfo/Idh/MocA family oxidoreductase [Bacteroidales bacterium]|jgi:myo-inositol 2-dehydrogenase/D-chiro-inositol 1-dehydrogenase|nr:Gfo/Idh/MocA family oxidoreductase [Bacteroidales bacterium]